MSADDEIRILKEGWRLLGHHVQAELIARGWAVADLAVADDEPLEFFWPPTAPVGYGDLPEPADNVKRRLRPFETERQTPWKAPTRITRDGDRWRVDYGEATARQPDRPRTYAHDAELLADIERIESWPMDLAETSRIRMERVLATTIADAFDDHCLAATVTEPYASRLRELRAHTVAEDSRGLGIRERATPSTPRPRGDLRARIRLVDAEAWASAVRTDRAGGEDGQE